MAQAGDVRGAADVDVLAGQEVEVTLRLREGIDLRGRCVDERGAPLVRWSIEVEAASRKVDLARAIHRVRTREDGTFVVRRCSASPLHLRVYEPQASIPCYERLIDDPQDPIAIVIPKEKRASARIVGRLLDESGRPARAAVQIGRADGPEGKVLGGRWICQPESAQGGAFEFGPVPPGFYDVAVSVPGSPGLEIGCYRVWPGRTLDLGTITVGSPVPLRVLVRNAARFPRLAVGLANGQSFVYLRREKDVFRHPRVLPGSYLLVLQGEGVALRTHPIVVRQALELELSASEVRPTRVRLIAPPRPYQRVYEWRLLTADRRTVVDTRRQGMRGTVAPEAEFWLDDGTYVLDATTSDGLHGQLMITGSRAHGKTFTIMMR
ncbi:MAG: carboxypeptidase regulatory-like domain-containing protein [Caldilineae bacterium]|nr:MAG: carboxypeptidase regulatory-like domain-containing protein [Caldilineae bacterium]